MYKLITAVLLTFITFNTYAISPEKISYCKAYSGGCLAWEYTTQGHGFWYDVSRGVNSDEGEIVNSD